LHCVSLLPDKSPDISPTLLGKVLFVKIGDADNPPTTTGLHLAGGGLGALHFIQHPLFFALSSVNQIVNRNTDVNMAGTTNTAAATEVPIRIHTNQKISVRKTPTLA
jgi:hypothetical protein